jgi:N-methylhydantoinase A
VEALGIPAHPYINQSNGGTLGIDEAARMPVRTVLSGPSAGVAGAAWLAAQAGVASVVTFDMGGTSTDVSFVRDGVPTLAFEREIGGVPLRVPALDIHTIGAGGGSVARRDSGGALLVGPESAGADPGPACYGKGGEAPTVTDANLVLGRLSPRGLLGGEMALDLGRAHAAVGALAGELGLSPVEAARGVIRVVDANMSRALRVVTVQRGIDPTELALLAFGGAGPLHAGALARDLGIRTILVPPGPGILCALGLLVEDLRIDLVHTWVGRLDAECLPILDRGFRALEAEATAWLDRERVAPARRQLARALDLRYEGQNYELSVPVPEETWTGHSLEALRRRFLQAHDASYGFAAEGEPIQVVNLRLVARGVAQPPEIPRQKAAGPDPSAALAARRPVDLAEHGGGVECPIFDRSRLAAGNRLPGPAVVEQFDSTTLILPGQEALVDELGCLVVTET